MTLVLINISSGIFAILMVVAAYKLYRLTRSSGIMVMLIASMYVVVVRLVIAFTETCITDASLLHYRTHLIAPFWPAMATGFFLLYRSLKELYTAGDRIRDEQYDLEKVGRERA